MEIQVRQPSGLEGCAVPSYCPVQQPTFLRSAQLRACYLTSFGQIRLVLPLYMQIHCKVSNSFFVPAAHDLVIIYRLKQTIKSQPC